MTAAEHTILKATRRHVDVAVVTAHVAYRLNKQQRRIQLQAGPSSPTKQHRMPWKRSLSSSRSLFLSIRVLLNLSVIFLTTLSVTGGIVAALAESSGELTTSSRQLASTNTSAAPTWQDRPCSELQVGQYRCGAPIVDNATQAAVNCTVARLVTVPCYPARGITCQGHTHDGRTAAFNGLVPCRYVTAYRYQTAVLLSIFTGVLGLDRLYLGYYAYGLVKACTFGLMFIGYLVDMLLIVTQTLRPHDGSDYIVDFYGQAIELRTLYNNRTFNLTFN